MLIRTVINNMTFDAANDQMQQAVQTRGKSPLIEYQPGRLAHRA